MPGAVRNADRIWVSTPQNRTYRAWSKLPNLFVKPHIVSRIFEELDSEMHQIFKHLTVFIDFPSLAVAEIRD